MSGRARGFLAGILLGAFMLATPLRAAVYVDAWIDAEAHIFNPAGPPAATVNNPPKQFSIFGSPNTISANATAGALSANASASGTLTVGPTGITVSGNASHNSGTASGPVGSELSGEVVFQVTSTQSATITYGPGIGSYQIHGPSVNEGLSEFGLLVPASLNRTFTPGQYVVSFLTSSGPNGPTSFSLPITMLAPEPSSLFALAAMGGLLMRRSRLRHRAAPRVCDTR